MAKKPAKPDDKRVTLLNLKGDLVEKAVVEEWTKKTGIPLSEIARRAMARWAKDRGFKIPPEWVFD